MNQRKRKSNKQNEIQQSNPLPVGFILKDAHMRAFEIQEPFQTTSSTIAYIARFLDDEETPNHKKVLDCEYVVRTHLHQNGPFFQKVHFFTNVFSDNNIISFVKNHALEYLGLPTCISHGTFQWKDSKYRYLVLEKFGRNIQEILNRSCSPFDVKSTFTIAVSLLYALEYLHCRGYSHGNISAANVFLGEKKETENRVYLLGMGSATRLTTDRCKSPDAQIQKQLGRVQFASRDCHNGALVTRRSDLEIMGYNLVYWLSLGLPWYNFTDPKHVYTSKQNFMTDIGTSLEQAFRYQTVPTGLEEYLTYVSHLKHDEIPNYDYCRQIFVNSAKKSGQSIDGALCFFTTQQWTNHANDTDSSTGPIASTETEPSPKRPRKVKNERPPLVLDPSIIPTEAMLDILKKRNAK